MDVDKEVEALAKEYEADKKEKQASSFEEIKGKLVLGARLLSELESKKEDLTAKLHAVNKQIQDTESDIRKKWGPFINGADFAEIDLGFGLTLISEAKLNIKVEEDDAATGWFLANGYKDVMKWQIHNQTLKKIARERYEKGDSIPGLSYQKHNVIKLK